MSFSSLLFSLFILFSLISPYFFPAIFVAKPQKSGELANGRKVRKQIINGKER